MTGFVTNLATRMAPWNTLNRFLSAVAVGMLGSSAFAQPGPLPTISVPQPQVFAPKTPEPDMKSFQPIQSLPSLAYPVMPTQAEAPKQPVDPKSTPIPAPRPAETHPRLVRQGSELGRTPPAPSPQDLAELNLVYDGTIDPKFTLDLVEGRARLIVLKEVPTQIQIAEEAIVSVNQLNPKQVTVLGRKSGTTVLNMWFSDPKDKTKDRVFSFLVRVVPDPELKKRMEAAYKALEEEINKNFPNSRVRLTLVGDKLMISGQAHDSYDATQILRIAGYNAPGSVFGSGFGGGGGNYPGTPTQGAGGSYYRGGAGANIPVGGLKSSLGDPNNPLDPSGAPGLEDYVNSANANVINNLRIPGEQQVMLRVVVAEVNRSAARSIGVNFSLFNSKGTRVLGQVTGGLETLAGTIVGGNIPLVLDNGRIPVAINALRTMNYARSLAEPNLTTMNGQPATFLAGGQFPVPVLGGFGTQGGAGGNAGTGGLQGVAFVPYGVQLQFTPYVTDRDRIRIVLNASVSTRDLGAAATINQTVVPGLNARTFSSTVEMREGQTIAVAGLIQTNLGTDSTRVPLLGDIPFLGRLASLDRVTHGEQELVVLITPELVHAHTQPELSPLPGSDIFEPGDLEFYLLGRLESRRSSDYRSAVHTDIHRMLRYQRCEQQYIIGPTGHSESLLSRPLSATAVGR